MCSQLKLLLDVWCHLENRRSFVAYFSSYLEVAAILVIHLAAEQTVFMTSVIEMSAYENSLSMYVGLSG